MTDTPTKSPRTNPLLDRLCDAYPVFKDGKPLALGIHKEIVKRMPDVDVAELRKTLHAYTNSTRYLKAQVRATERFDLDGAPAGELSQEHRDIAGTTLKERIKRATEKRKLAEKALKQAQEEEQARQQMSGKLNELAAKFNTR